MKTMRVNLVASRLQNRIKLGTVFEDSKHEDCFAYRRYKRIVLCCKLAARQQNILHGTSWYEVCSL